MDQQLSYKLSLDIVDLKKKAKEAQDEINRIEQEILELNRLKVELVDPKDKAMAKQVRQEIERLNNALKEQRLALRTVNEATKEKTKLLKEAVKAQNEVTDSIERSRVEAKKELAEMKLSDRRAAVQADKDAAKAKKEAEAASKALAISLNRESNAMSGLTKQQQQFRNQAGASNNVALEFNRIIQDAPFGIIGIGNNIQQLTANFSQLKATSTSTGAALSSALSSIISPANLVLLGISALTSLWTAYQLGAFDSAEETKSLADVMDELDEEISNTVDSLGALEKAFYKSASGAFQEKLELDSLFAIMRDSNKSIETRILAYDTLMSRYPTLLEGLTKEKALTGDLTKEYTLLVQAIEAKAFASALEGELTAQYKEQLSIEKQYNAEIAKELAIQTQIRDLEKRIRDEKMTGGAKGLIIGLEGQVEDLREALLSQQGVSDATEKLFKAQGDEIDNLTDKLISANVSLADYGLGVVDVKKPLEEVDETQRLFIGGIEITRDSLGKLMKDLNGYVDVLNLLKDQSFEEGFDQPISTLSTGTQESEFLGNMEDREKKISQYKEQADEIAGINQMIKDSFGAMATAIVATFDIQNDSLKGFVTTLVSNVPRIISAIQKTAAANKAAADAGVISAKKGALANGIFMATETGKTLGPIGLALLPVLIGGAMALISSAFGKAGTGGGGGVSAAVGSNASASSSFSGNGLGFTGFGDFDMSTVLKGTDIVLSIKRTQNANA